MTLFAWIMSLAMALGTVLTSLSVVPLFSFQTALNSSAMKSTSLASKLAPPSVASHAAPSTSNPPTVFSLAYLDALCG